MVTRALGTAAAPVALRATITEGRIAVIQPVDHPETTTALYRQRMLAEALEGLPIGLTLVETGEGTPTTPRRRR